MATYLFVCLRELWHWRSADLLWIVLFFLHLPLFFLTIRSISMVYIRHLVGYYAVHLFVYFNFLRRNVSVLTLNHFCLNALALDALFSWR